MIKKSDILMGRDEEFPLTPALKTNLNNLFLRVTGLLHHYSNPDAVDVASGYRPGHYNTDAHGAPNSCHKFCMAVDLHDRENQTRLKDWLLANLPLLEEYDLYLENPASTPTWSHVQTRKPRSGNRVFIP